MKLEVHVQYLYCHTLIVSDWWYEVVLETKEMKDRVVAFMKQDADLSLKAKGFYPRQPDKAKKWNVK